MCYGGGNAFVLGVIINGFHAVTPGMQPKRGSASHMDILASDRQGSPAPIPRPAYVKNGKAVVAQMKKTKQ